MDRKLGRLIAAALLGASLTASASPSDAEYGSVTAYGLANEPCGAYMEARRDPNSFRAYGYKQFIGGFLTAYGNLKMKSYPTSLAGIEGWLENYCVKNPEQDFLFALHAYGSSH